MSRIGAVTSLGLAALAFVLYLGTMAPGLDAIDVGELATVARTLGVAHPTGYPLFTLAAHLFSRLPVGTVIWRLNLMNALFCATAVGVFFFTAREFLRMAAGGPRAESEVLSAAVSATVVLSLDRTFWTISTSLEVYGLHVIFLATILLLSLRLHQEKDERRRRRLGWAFAFSVGLSFTNHLGTVMLAPACLALHAMRFGVRAPSWKRLAGMTPFLVAPLLLYAYLPLRAAADPLMNWGDVVSLDAFAGHVTGRQYSPLMLGQSARVSENFASFWRGLPGETGWPVLLLAALGVASLARASARGLVFSLILFCGCLFYAVTYGIDDIASYYAQSYLAIALWAGLGCLAVLRWTGNRAARRALLFLLPAGIALSMGARNYGEVDRRDFHLVEDFAGGILRSVDPGSVVITSSWDLVCSPALYLQNVEGLRPDVVVLDRFLMTHGWYLDQAMRRHPDLFGPVETLARRYLDAEERGALDGPSFAEVLEAFLRGVAASSRPLYTSLDVGPVIGDVVNPVPEGFLMRLYRRGEPVKDLSFEEPAIRPARIHDAGAAKIYEHVVTAYGGRALFEERRRSPEAARYARAALDTASLIRPRDLKADARENYFRNLGRFRGVLDRSAPPH